MLKLVNWAEFGNFPDKRFDYLPNPHKVREVLPDNE